MKIKLDTAITTCLVICALITTGIVLRREFLLPPATAQVEKKPALISGWREYLTKGVRFGPAAAPVQLIEFADFECPFCGDLHNKLKVLQERYPTQVSLTYIHFPIQGHRFAIPAARAAECAGEQGRFQAMYDQLFDGQDSFGLKPWAEYAAAAGVPDRLAFDSCVKKTGAVSRIESGRELGEKLGVQGTPTLIVNGWKLGRPPTPEEMDAMVKAILAGKPPVAATTS
jgi:protein-disulfide isomerase